jgi:hypothetical protein
MTIVPTELGQSIAPCSSPTQTLDLAFLGAPPLIPGENVAAYEKLRAYVSTAVNALDIFEAIWLREFVDKQWEIDRYHRVKANLIRGAKKMAAFNVLRPLVAEGGFDMMDRASTLAEGWTKGDQQATKEVKDLLQSADLTEDAIVAEAVSIKRHDLEHIDRMIMTMEARRDNDLAELDLHRKMRGARCRFAVEQVQDVEFHVIEDKRSEQKKLAS